MKFWLSLCTIVVVSNTLSTAYGGEKEEQFPKNDFKTIFNDIYQSLGLKQASTQMSIYFKKSVRTGQKYNWEAFQKDFQDLKNNPSHVFCFFRKMFWPIVVHSSLKLMETVSYLQEFLLKFMKKKCDVYIGKDALFHPWNILNDSDTQNVSFIVFVYAVAISLILIRLVSWWNFMVYMALLFLCYSFGGPYLVFKWLLCITSAVWFTLDTVLKYPFQVAVVIIAVFLLSYIKGAFGLVSSSPLATASGVSTPIWKVEKRFQHIDHSYNSLTERVQTMEQKTNLLNKKLDMLSKSMDRLTQSDIED